jgi:hypothetical protein
MRRLHGSGLNLLASLLQLSFKLHNRSAASLTAALVTKLPFDPRRGTAANSKVLAGEALPFEDAEAMRCGIAATDRLGDITPKRGTTLPILQPLGGSSISGSSFARTSFAASPLAVDVNTAV